MHIYNLIKIIKKIKYTTNCGNSNNGGLVYDYCALPLAISCPYKVKK